MRGSPSSAYGPEMATYPHASVILREWVDALIIAFILATFVRVFVLEVYKIPSGSMSPALIGGQIAQVDVTGDEIADLLLFQPSARPLLFENDGVGYIAKGDIYLSQNEVDEMREQGLIEERYDHILVNKMAYWFRGPRRGDIVVFKVPEAIWTDEKPIYIKRCVGLPEETLAFDSEGHLQVDGEPVRSPIFFSRQSYRNRVEYTEPMFREQPGVVYETADFPDKMFNRLTVPEGEYFVFGDNTHRSLDSRYWGGVQQKLFKGRAFMRCWPPGQVSLLRPR